MILHSTKYIRNKYTYQSIHDNLLNSLFHSLVQTRFIPLPITQHTLVDPKHNPETEVIYIDMCRQLVDFADMLKKRAVRQFRY